MADSVDALGDGGGDVVDARGMPRAHAVGAPTIKDSDFVSDAYKMNHANRGTAIIINNKNFQPRTGMGERSGTDVDAEKMYTLFDTMGFEKIIQSDNLTVRQMKDQLISVAKRDHTTSDCFVCVILSHGEEGYIFGVDDKISIDELVLPFKGHNCLSLAGKPKIFFIQACRGTELDQGTEVADSGKGEEEMEEEIEIRRIPTEADFLMAYSVVPGYFAWRNSSRGSWFIQAVYDVISSQWKDLDLLTMMTRVNKKVAYDFQSNASKEYMNRKKQIPCITSMLTKDVFFTKK